MLQASINESLIAAGIISDQHRRADLDLAAAVQRQMMPRQTKQLNSIRYSGVSTAAQGIGGDYYDFLDLGSGALGLILADVSGKGVAAALLMANLQASIRSESAHNTTDTREMLHRVNAHFFNSTLPAQYATLFFGNYNDRARSLEYINCGQQPALIMRDDGSIERMETSALPLGLVKNWDGEKKTVELHSGDMLFICSDGVIEAGIESGCELGEDGLISILRTVRDQPIERAVALIANATHAFAPNGLSDDMTILGVRSV
jgi:serine phosphatase RsbU (regulator of sigma subunit)